jgi:hypothetical protein
MICPRCHVSGLVLSRIRGDYPDVVVEKLEYFTHVGQAKRDGVRGIPTLVANDGRRLGGVFLTPAAIRRFLAAL